MREAARSSRRLELLDRHDEILQDAGEIEKGWHQERIDALSDAEE
jgi:hypothetical protein